MKDFFVYLIKSPGKMFFLLFVNVVIFLAWFNLLSDPGDCSPLTVGIILGCTVLLDILCFAQVWREYKGI